MHRSTFPYELPRGYASDNTKDNPYPLENPAGKKKSCWVAPSFTSQTPIALLHHIITLLILSSLTKANVPKQQGISRRGKGLVSPARTGCAACADSGAASSAFPAR